MDPDETLREGLLAARLVIAGSDDVESLRAADALLNLHDWCSKGGFLPAAWTMDRAGRVRG